MSFNFSWPKFSRQFHADAARMLDYALNRGPKPKVIADDIKVEDINMGTIPPELEILEIGELSSERLRGIFRLTYTGDAHLLLSTKVQANPLNRPEPSSGLSPFEDVSSAFPSSTTSRGILFAARPLVVPMQLRLSSVRLKAIVVLVVSKQKGITLVFKNDPLESVEVSSTFDSVAVIQKYLQQEIEGQLREMFREDLPGIIHRLSQTWLSGRNRKTNSTSATVPTNEKASMLHQESQPYISTEKASQIASQPEARRARSSASVPASRTAKSPARRRRTNTGASLATPSSSPPAKSSTFSTPRAPHRFTSNTSSTDASVKASSPSTSPSKRFANSTVGERSLHNDHEADMSFSSSIGSISGFSSGYVHDIEHYDPTYGLRPDEIRVSANSSNFSGLAQLAQRGNRGLRDFASLSLSNDNQQINESVSSPPRSIPISKNYELSPHSEAEPELDNVEEGDEEDDDMEEGHGKSIRHWSELDDVPDHPALGQSPTHLLNSHHELDLQDSEYSEEEDLNAVEGMSSDRDSNFSGFDRSSPEIELSKSLGGENGSRSRSNSNYSRSKHQAFSSRMSATGSRSRSSTAGGGKTKDTEVIEYDRFPAVGGGTVVRPRVYHMASQVQAPEVEEEDDIASSKVLDSIAASSTIHGPASSRTFTIRPDHDAEDDEDFINGHNRRDSESLGDYNTDESPSAAGHESLMTLDPDEMDPSSIAYRTQLYRHQYGRMYRPGYGRQSSLGSTDLSSSDGSSRYPSHSPDEEFPNRHRAWTPASRASTAPTSTFPSAYSTQPSSSSLANTTDVKQAGQSRYPSQRMPGSLSTSNSGNAMTLDASNHFMDLVNSNHTLSPFTRTLDTKGFAVRSHPVTPTSPSVVSGSTTNGSGNSRSGWTRGDNFQRRSSQSSLRTHSFSNHSQMDERGSNSGMSSPSIGNQKAGRRRIFKLGGSSKSAGNTPTQIPGTPTLPDNRSQFDRMPSSTQQKSNLSDRSFSSTTQEQDRLGWQSRSSSIVGGQSNNDQLRLRRASSHNSDPPRRRRLGQNNVDLHGHPDFASFHHMSSIRE